MDYIDIKKLTLDELMGVVSLYPWYGGARKELCKRMAGMGGGGLGESQYADAAMYVGTRSKLSDLMRSSSREDCTDVDVEKLIKSYIAQKQEVPAPQAQTPTYTRKVHVVGGDYFSIEDYEQVRHAGDNVFSRYAAKAREEAPVHNGMSAVEFDLYTETLAQIYAEQGYYEQAKHIYSKLILAYPEKNAYFAALIQKLNEIN